MNVCSLNHNKRAIYFMDSIMNMKVILDREPLVLLLVIWSLWYWMIGLIVQLHCFYDIENYGTHITVHEGCLQFIIFLNIF